MHTALVLDIDGVICPAAERSGLVEVGMALRPVLVCPESCAAITALAARPGIVAVWLTSWLPETRRAMRSPFPGHDWPQLDLAPRRDSSWPKWPALAAWLAGQRQLDRLVWIDDDLNGDHISRVRGLGLDALTLAPEPGTGITAADLQRVADWLSRKRA